MRRFTISDCRRFGISLYRITSVGSGHAMPLALTPRLFDGRYDIDYDAHRVTSCAGRLPVYIGRAALDDGNYFRASAGFFISQKSFRLFSRAMPRQYARYQFMANTTTRR